MIRERSISGPVTRRDFIASTFATLLYMGLPIRAAATDEPTIGKISIVENPTTLVARPDRLFYMKPIGTPLTVPFDSTTQLRMSIAAELNSGSSRPNAAGIFIENGLKFGDPNFARTLFRRIAYQGTDAWAVAQLVGDKIEPLFDLIPGTSTAEIETMHSHEGKEGSISINGESVLGLSLKYPIYGPLSRTEQLTFLAYAEGDASVTISSVEAVLRTT